MRLKGTRRRKKVKRRCSVVGIETLCLPFFAACVALCVETALSLTAVPQRVCLVTGGNKGIGKEIARSLGSHDDHICVIGCRDEKLGIAAANELKDEGCNVSFVHLDLDDENTAGSAMRFIEQEYGRLDVLVNNAAVCFNDPTLYGKVPYTSFEKQAGITIRTNFFGTMAVTKAMLPLLRASPSPRIVNIASSAGRLAILRSQERVDAFTSPKLRLQELEGFMREFISDVEEGNHAEKGWPNTCYGVSKVGIIAMTKVLARGEPTIMVNSVDPGYCATDQNNNQGFLPPERGARTPFLLATLPDDQFFSGMHWFQEQQIKW